jgi:hypothetical protein
VSSDDQAVTGHRRDLARWAGIGLRDARLGLPRSDHRPAPAHRHRQRAVPAVRPGRRPGRGDLDQQQQRRTINAGQVVLRPFADLDPKTQAALNTDAADVTRFLGKQG